MPKLSEGQLATKVSILKFLRQYEETVTLSHKPGSGQTLKMIDTTISFTPKYIIRMVRAFTALVALPVPFIDYMRHRICTRVQTHCTVAFFSTYRNTCSGTIN